jgi:hypothetical protein
MPKISLLFGCCLAISLAHIVGCKNDVPEISAKKLEAWIDRTLANESMKTMEAYRHLVALRAGDTNSVIAALERDLDMGALVLGECLSESPDKIDVKRTARFLIRVRDYRKAHPTTQEDPDSAKRLTEILAMDLESLASDR